MYPGIRIIVKHDAMFDITYVLCSIEEYCNFCVKQTIYHYVIIIGCSIFAALLYTCVTYRWNQEKINITVHNTTFAIANN